MEELLVTMAMIVKHNCYILKPQFFSLNLHDLYHRCHMLFCIHHRLFLLMAMVMF